MKFVFPEPIRIRKAALISFVLDNKLFMHNIIVHKILIKNTVSLPLLGIRPHFYEVFRDQPTLISIAVVYHC